MIRGAKMSGKEKTVDMGATATVPPDWNRFENARRSEFCALRLAETFPVGCNVMVPSCQIQGGKVLEPM